MGFGDWIRRKEAPRAPWFDENRRTHLVFIQQVIARLAGNSFLIKGWSLTIAVAVYGFAAQFSRPGIAVLGLLPALTFWVLDAYYLHRERLFRRLYDAARDPARGIDVFDMHAENFAPEIYGWARTMWNKTIWPYYLTSITVGALTFIATNEDFRKGICKLIGVSP